MPLAQKLGLVYLLSELLLTVTRRGRSRSGESQDRSTLRTLWLVIALSVAAGVYAAGAARFAALEKHRWLDLAALLFFVSGLALRWWAIVVLGRFFTVNVTIEKDHEVVQAGPYRAVRHPSYTGVLLAFLGFALSLHNWLSLVFVLVPITIALLHRMNVEEQALLRALGERYFSYMAGTKRLLPFVY